MSAFLSLAAVALGLAALVWSADRFVAGSAATARLLGLPPLLVGMVIIGFGTSAPELAVSAIGAAQGNPEIALGNAYGSNVCNIALILGLAALLRPPVVRRSVATRHLPALLGATLLSFWLVGDTPGATGISRADAVTLLSLFAIALWWMARGSDGGEGNASSPPPRAGRAAADLLLGLAGLVLASRALVWGAVRLATLLGVPDLVIGLTVVAVGTSLPELASTLAAVRRGEDDLAVGNIVGSNLFNTLAVVGLAGAIRPMPSVDPAVLHRDLPVSFALALLLLVFGRPRRGGPGRLGRLPGAAFLLLYAAYLVLLVRPSGPS